MDAESVIQIQNLILTLNKEGKTIFMTSHNLDEVEKICTRIAIMKEGKIHSSGTMKELKDSYQTKSMIQVKLSSTLEKEHKDRIQSLLSYPTEWKENVLMVPVPKEKEIPAVIHALSQEGINIYSVHVEEPSLQEIFLRQ